MKLLFLPYYFSPLNVDLYTAIFLTIFVVVSLPEEAGLIGDAPEQRREGDVS